MLPAPASPDVGYHDAFIVQRSLVRLYDRFFSHTDLVLREILRSVYSILLSLCQLFSLNFLKILLICVSAPREDYTRAREFAVSLILAPLIFPPFFSVPCTLKMA